MANRSELLPSQAPSRALEKARADLARGARRAPEEPAAAVAAAPESPEPAPRTDEIRRDAATTFGARLDLLRARLAQARGDTISALLFLGDAQRDCDALTDACDQAGWPLTGQGVVLLSDALRRATPSELRHLDLVSLLIDALVALRRAESRPDMARTGAELLRGLKLAISRELGSGDA